MTAFGQLFIVATPIGNLGDMTLRAIDCLKSVDWIACEDTRTSGKLLNHFGINSKTLAYHDFNADTQTDKIIDLLKMGKHVALISDAGTPLISDPGFRLVRACHQNNIKVVPIVGASAVIGALSVAGLPSDRFLFCGFLSAKAAARQSQLQDLKHQPTTLIFYEAPHRLLACLNDMVDIFGENREATLCREISKTFETIRLDSLANLSHFVQSDSHQQKGEIVLVVAGCTKQKDNDSEHDALLLRLLQDLPIKKAVVLASDLTGLKKNALYDRALQLKASGIITSIDDIFGISSS